MRKIIENIKLPNTNIYYENDSADGFGFLGCARAKVQLDYSECYKAINKRDFCLNSSQTIRGIKVPKNNQYVYTMWACMEFLSVINDEKCMKILLDRINKIGCYPNGMMRYCSSEIEFLVPNVTSAAALMYGIMSYKEKSKIFVELLRDKQVDGNWWYYDFKTNKKIKPEGPYHLAMIVYHLRELQKVAGIYTEDIVMKSVRQLRKMNEKILQPGTIGWGIPMLYMAVKNIDNQLCKRAYTKLIADSINHKNFRVRGMAAWAIIK